MSKRSSILAAIADKLATSINGIAPFNTNLYGNAYPKLKFWDEVQDFSSIYMSPGTETREYLPGGFKWAFLLINIKAYVKCEDPQEQLELLLEDIERVIDNNREIVYDSVNNYTVTDINIQSITTDEGLLAPYGVGEIILQVRYDMM